MLRVLRVSPLTLVEVQALAASEAYGGARTISGSTAATLLCVAAWLSDHGAWVGEDDELSDSEADVVDELVATIVHELIAEGSGVVQDYVKIDEVIYTADIAEPYIDGIDASDYDEIRLVATGLLSNYAGNWVDSLEIEHNDYADNSKYTSFCNFLYNGSSAQAQWILNHPGNVVYFGCATSQGFAGISSSLEVVLFAPSYTGFRSGIYRGNVASKTTNNVAFVQGTHGIFVGEACDKILIRPYSGTSFLVGGVGEPSELKLSLYGIK